MFIEVVHAAEEAAAADAGVLGSFGVNWQLLSAQLLNFAILLFVLYRWVYKPLLKVLDERKKTVETGLRQAKDAEAALTSAEAKKEELLSVARSEAQDIVRSAKKAGDDERDRRVHASNAIIESRLQEAKDGIERERQISQEDAQKHIAELVAEATEKVAKLGLKEADQRKLITEALNELESASL